MGIDYAAPTSTPVLSVGDNAVIFRGWKRAYEYYVEVRHNSVFTTCYGHLSRYAKGIAVGTRVKQGQLVGYVGSTGWSTGPHLDFRVRKNGDYMNFLSLKFPPDKNVPNAHMLEFKTLATERLWCLDDLFNKTLQVADGQKKGL